MKINQNILLAKHTRILRGHAIDIFYSDPPISGYSHIN